MVKSGLCLLSLLNSTNFTVEKDTIIQMIKYLTINSTSLLSSLSQYNDNSYKLSHAYTLSLLLNEKYEYLLSMNADSTKYPFNDPISDLYGTFRRIMKNKNDKKKIFLKRKKKNVHAYLTR